MRFLTVEVEIDHGRISLGGGEALPDKAIGLFTILSPEVMDSEFKTNELQLSQALASGLLTFLTSSMMLCLWMSSACSKARELPELALKRFAERTETEEGRHLNEKPGVSDERHARTSVNQDSFSLDTTRGTKHL